MEPLKQIDVLIFMLIVSFIPFSDAQENSQIFRWVDDNGVVHYADQAKNNNAVAVNVKETVSNSAIKSEFELPDISQVSNNDSPAKSNKKVLSEEDQQYCDYIREQIKLAKEAVEMGNELRSDYASAYIKSSDKLLKDNHCI